MPWHIFILENFRVINKYQKLDAVKSILSELKTVAVAYSGGIDSSFLLKIGYDVLGEKCAGITAVSEVMLKHELESIDRIIKLIGVTHYFVQSYEMDDPDFISNSADRCYYCKARKLDAIFACAAEHGFQYIVDGTNVDDRGDHRPGKRAAKQRGVRSPLEEAGLSKQEIRELAREVGLPNWNQPEDACLASRIPYNTPITEENLQRVDRAEQYLRSLRLQQLRVRYHGAVARIEVEQPDFEVILKHKDEINKRLQAIGFTFITLDLAGFRSGNLNKLIK
ncbi:ATP-dependent sacrificial sulfur transferase LarE [candidate division KSB1 bacterium]|nr:ATP-dependent sacrificial sulfur transferase LarE [candidate division KSB1 bacterium]